MMPLVPLEERHVGAFDEIIHSKEEPRLSILRRLRSLLARRYRAYSSARHELAALPRSYAYFGVTGVREAILASHACRGARKQSPAPRSSFETSEREALLQCYDGETNGRKEMLGRIRKLQPAKQRWYCQYCCGMSRSATWDHYLHKAQFPEFSVYAPNLVPSCGECNGLRRAWIKYGKRTSINFYYDRLDPMRPLIQAKIAIGDDGDPEVTFSLMVRRVSRTRFGRLFERHWRALDLERRLREGAPTTLAVLQAHVEVRARDVRVSAQDLAEELASEAECLRRSLGANHIQTVIYRAAAVSPELIEYYLKRAP